MQIQVTDASLLHKLFAEEGVEIPEEAMLHVVRKLSNPAGCHWCGARTKVGVVVPAKGKTPEYVKLACCGKKVS